MKTVSGTMVSTKVVSLSKAARILSKFAFTDNGASPAFAAYLKHASTSFDEIVQFHKEIKGPGSERKDRKKKHGSSSGVVNDETLNSVRRHSKDNNFLTQEKQFSSGLRKHVHGDDMIDDNVNSNGVENYILKHDSNKDKKRKDKDKEKNIDDASNRAASEIGGVDVAKETKGNKKRDKDHKSDSDLKIAVEEKSCPPSEDQEAAKAQANDEGERIKHKKKKKKELEKEESTFAIGSKQKDPIGVNGDVDGYVNAKKQVDGDNGERKKHEKKQNQGRERNGEDNGETQVANDISRKRKHTAVATHEELDNSEELHRLKRKKK